MSGAAFVYTPAAKRITPWQHSLGLSGVSSRLEVIALVQRGLPATAFEHFSDAVGVSREELARVARTSTRTVLRRKEAGQRLDSGTSERLVRLAELYSRAAEVIGDGALAKQWMRTPRAAFEGQTPFDLAASELGAQEVEDLLLRVEHGVFY